MHTLKRNLEATRFVKILFLYLLLHIENRICPCEIEGIGAGVVLPRRSTCQKMLFLRQRRLFLRGRQLFLRGRQLLLRQRRLLQPRVVLKPFNIDKYAIHIFFVSAIKLLNLIDLFEYDK